MKASLIITSQNRNHHLINLLHGINHNKIRPDEIIIVSNDAQQLDLEFVEIPINILHYLSEDFDIGINRSLGAEKAQYERLHFLDVDCIPEQDYFLLMNNDIEDKGGLIMGQPLYLGDKVSPPLSYVALRKDAIFHPYRPKVDKLQQADDYAVFWSLCFSIHKKDFDKIGGFDEQFKGYGAEDTDFAFMAREKQVPFHLSPAKVYHQQHPICRPPLNHLEDIVYNSNLFYKKWQKWPMSGWLTEFVEKGWIAWNENSNKDIEIIELPSDKVVKSHMIEDGRFV